jgi:hypothetical protein
MRILNHSRQLLHITILLSLCLAFLLPAGASATAQFDECPEGEVYDEEQDLCVLPPEEEDDDATDEGLQEDTEDTGDIEDAVDEAEDIVVEEDVEDVTDTEDAADIVDEEDTTDTDDVDDVEQSGDVEDMTDETGEEEPGYIAEFSLLHFACEHGFDPLENTTNFEDLWHLCSGSGKPQFTYHLYVDQELITTFGMTTGDDGPGEITLPPAQDDPISSGYVTLIVEPYPDYVSRYVTCITNERGRFDLEIDQASLVSSVSFAAYPDEEIQCEWYHVPYGQFGSGTSTSFSVTKYACPNANTPGLYDFPWTFYSTNCTETIAGQEFSLYSGNDGPIPKQTESDGRFQINEIIESGAELPTWTVVEHIPDGFGEPIVFCGPNDQGYKEEMNLNDGNSITVALGKYEPIIYCDWFNIPNDTQPATILLSVLDCPEGTAPQDELAELCAYPDPNVPFSLVSNNETLAEVTSDDFGEVYFENVLPGDIAIVEEVPPGYGQPVVICNYDTTAPSQLEFEPDVLDGSVNVELEAGDFLFCAWYNLPTPGAVTNEVTVQFWVCPEDVLAEANETDLLLYCEVEQEDRDVIVIIGDESTDQAITGEATWEFEGDQFRLDGGNDGDNSIWCSSAWMEGEREMSEFHEPVTAENGVLTLEITHPDSITFCSWFVAEPEAGTLPDPPALALHSLSPRSI